MSTLTIILGNQLFDYQKYYNFPSHHFFMCEDRDLCTHFHYHKQKILFFLVSMRKFSKNFKNIDYYKLSEKSHFFEKLELTIQKKKITTISMYEIEDKFFEQKISNFAHRKNLKINYLKSPMFLVSREDFKRYNQSQKKPFLNTFYILLRKRFNLLLEDNNTPLGGSWSHDQKNRKKIPKKDSPPRRKYTNQNDPIIDEVKKVIEEHFDSHVGSLDHFIWHTEPSMALKSYKKYLKTFFKDFGTFQDALDERDDFLYHSLISPYINIGFLTPKVVIQEAIKLKNDVPINSLEGFVRQVLGWREFMRGLYQQYSYEFETRNFFHHTKKLSKHWYDGTTGIEPLDFAIKKALRTGYNHHIERLMVIGNLMLLLEVHPLEVYKWFMEMFVDSSDWVMQGNVFGMSQFSDGGIFATKPYICGSNYLLKMSHYSKNASWCEGVDGLYWSFIEKNKAFFSKNPRLSMMVKILEKMDEQKKIRIFAKANNLRKKLTSV